MLEPSGEDGLDLALLDADAIDVVELDDDAARLDVGLPGPRLEVSRASALVPSQVVAAPCAPKSTRPGVPCRREVQFTCVALVPLIAFGLAALGLVMLGIAGPVYRLGLSLPTAYAIMRWARVRRPRRNGWWRVGHGDLCLSPAQMARSDRVGVLALVIGVDQRSSFRSRGSVVRRTCR